MIMYVVYEKVSGRIAFVQRGGITPRRLEPGHSVMESEDKRILSSDWYVSAGKLRERPKMNVEWSFDEGNRELTVKHIPPATTVTVENWSGLVDDGYIIWPLEEPGTYQVRLECFPYQSERINATVT